MRFVLLAGYQGQIGKVKGGDIVLFGLASHCFVARAVAQPHKQFLAGVVSHSGRGGSGDQRCGGVSGVGHEDLTPVGRAGSRAHILHVENEIVKILVEDARLNFVRGLHSKRLVHRQNCLIGARCQIERIGQSQERAANGNDGGHTHKVADAQPGGAHGDDFTVGGQAAQPQQHPHQYRHGNGNHEKVGHHEKNDFHNADESGAIVDHHLQNAGQLLHEENEGEDHATDKGVGENFAGNVSVQDAHK